MKNFSNEFWSISLPDDWEAEHDPECETMYQPDGYGALQISATRQNELITDRYLEEIAAEHINAGAGTYEVELGQFDGLSFCYDVDDEYWCEWYLKSGQTMLFVTYVCDVEDEGKEDDLVDHILESLTVIEPRAS